MINLQNKETRLKFFELTDRVLKLIDEQAEDKLTRGDLQGVVEAIIMNAMNHEEVLPMDPVGKSLRDKMNHYVLFIESDIEPHLHGPFNTEEERDAKARQLREDEGDFHGIYFFDTEADVSQIEIGTYSGNFFE